MDRGLHLHPPMRAVPWVILSLATTACGGEVIVGNPGGGEPSTGGPAPAPAPSPATSDKVDLLIVVDNSRSMADKQAVLADGVPELLGFLTNPRCFDPQGAVVAQPAQPATADAPCPAGSERELPPVKDLHVGVITSSIGGHGGDLCDSSVMMNQNFSVDDRAHLISRSSTSGQDPSVPTYQGLGFLAWDPLGQKSPPGAADSQAMQTLLASLVVGAGEVGCGLEAPLEAWYRFLVDPDPYDSIAAEDSNLAVISGTDQTLLAQRAAFLRPDSVLMVVMLSDENDCSIRDGGHHYFASQMFTPGTTTPYHLPAPRAACATDPNSPCCRSCGQNPGEGCDTSQDPCPAILSPAEDKIDLRCFDQKRRFGVDFNWPVDRYVSGLTDPTIADRHGNVVDNPLFAGGRHPSMVYLASIVGVPWQDVARRDPDGTPNVAAGYMSAAELANNAVWDVIVGDPASYTPPLDPLMIESVEPRSGENPITGDTIAPPGAPFLANPINGHEYSANNALQYACIFPLPVAHDCSAMGASSSCRCVNPDNDNPVCQAPHGSFGTTQYFGTAYPGIRQLSVLKALGPQAVVGSICPAQLSDATGPAFAYRPTFAALAAAAKPAITD
jgi:hypothetical protein